MVYNLSWATFTRLSLKRAYTSNNDYKFACYLSDFDVKRGLSG